MVAEFVVSALLSAFLNVLFERLATVQTLTTAMNLIRRSRLRGDLLQKMEILLLRVEKVLGDAEEKQIMNPSVKKWVDKLTDAAYDAEDLLDAMAIGGSFHKTQVDDFNTRLDKIVQKLDLIASEKDILSLYEGHEGKSLTGLPTTSLVDESEVCFRNGDKKHIVDILLSDDVNGQRIPVIAIVGMGGSGKTTLAQFLYNYDRVENYFDLRAWVYVSGEFDVFKVTKTIYESATLSHSDIEDLNVLQLTLQKTLKGKKFLLVLDDVWNESYREWDLLRRPLQVGAPGSKIIVTTRSQSVASTMLPALVHDLKRLSKEDCWSLFSKHAFGNRDPNEDSTLKEIGERIVKKCQGLPLAIKTLGSLLHSQIEAEEWDNVLNSRIWDLPDHKSDILPALRLSYHYLPSQLKRCFAYCSIFPKGHKFEKGDLVRMWIAEGLVQQPHGRRKEEVGEKYFHELLSRSIFQKSHDESRFIMHDLVNELAQYIAGEFCLRLEHDSPPQNPARVRHLSCILKPMDNAQKFEAFFGRNNIFRTFLLKSSDEKVTPFSSFDKLFQANSCLRVLSFSRFRIVKFPKSAKLKQLRYLDLSGTAIGCLSEIVGCLENLETLKLSGCNGLTLLPANLWNLTKLEHLDIKGTHISMLPDSIGNLKELGYLDLSGTRIQVLPEGVCSSYNLHTLKLSPCRDLNCLPTCMGNLIKLKHLDIKGTPIGMLPDSIGDLNQLGYLDLSETGIQFLPERVCSLYNLQTLKLSGCLDLTCLPTSMENLTKLTHLDIKGTAILQMPPNFGNLKRLQLLTNFVVGNNSGSTISELEHLSLLHGTLSILQLKYVSQTADAEKANLKGKKYLRELILEWDVDPRDGNAQIAACNPRNGNIQNAAGDRLNGNAQNAADDHHNGHAEIAPGSPLINGDTQNAVDDSQNRSGQSAGDDHQNPSAQHAVNVLDKLQPGETLERLEIRNFFGMSLPRWLGNASFAKMEGITLYKCLNCNSLPPLGQLPSLKELTIHGMAGVKIVDGEFYGGVAAFKSLKVLSFQNMENWERWFPFCDERGFPSLRTLTLFGCRKLTGPLPTEHLRLEESSIQECNNLQCQGTTNEKPLL